MDTDKGVLVSEAAPGGETLGGGNTGDRRTEGGSWTGEDRTDRGGSKTE